MTDKPDQPSAAEAEATGAETVTVTFDGADYEIPASVDDVDIEVVRAFERNHTMAIVENVLGPRQWRELERSYRKAHGGKFPARALVPLAEQIAQAWGFDSTGG